MFFLRFKDSVVEFRREPNFHEPDNTFWSFWSGGNTPESALNELCPATVGGFPRCRFNPDCLPQLECGRSIVHLVSTCLPKAHMADLQVAPAPWKLKGRSWIFPLAPLSKVSSFPAGWSTPYQAEALSTGGTFIGGIGQVQIVSYSESPVGPYDELMYVPGRWKYSDGTKAWRITQIYVSTRVSIMNGRKNWNIPKHLADFDISTTSDGTTTISVSHPGTSVPFFKASTKKIPVVSSLSIHSSTSVFGKYFGLVQPPLPVGEVPENVGTSQWAALTPILRGSTSLRTMTPGLAGKAGDGVGFPAVAPWPIAVSMENLDVEFGEAVMQDGV